MNKIKLVKIHLEDLEALVVEEASVDSMVSMINLDNKEVVDNSVAAAISSKNSKSSLVEEAVDLDKEEVETNKLKEVKT
jgi:hypothetical protein